MAKIPPQFLKHVKSAAKKMAKKGGQHKMANGKMMSDAEMKAKMKAKGEVPPAQEKKLPPWLQKKK